MSISQVLHVDHALASILSATATIFPSMNKPFFYLIYNKVNFCLLIIKVLQI